MQSVKEEVTVWKLTPLVWAVVVVTAIATFIAFYGGFEQLVRRYNKYEEYSYGYMIPFVSLFFVLQKKDILDRLEFCPNWWGVAIVVLGTALLILGELSALFIFVHYGFVFVLFGLVVAFMGLKATRVILVPLLILLFAIPLPYFIDSDLSGELQLISSQLGVSVIRLFDIPVYLEGNVIDLGIYKLQVVEACSGLRYLYPLMAFGFICAYIWRAPFWKKVVLFLSTIPITIFMNSFRIGVIGVLVEKAGIEQAEGFLHDFEGWIIFMSCVVILFIEMYLLGFIGSSKYRGFNIVNLDLPPLRQDKSDAKYRKVSSPFIVASVIVFISTIATISISNRADAFPSRSALASFPLELGMWRGEHGEFKESIISALKFTDYLMADFTREPADNVNVYVAYYENQRKGNSPHSPRVCIPGGGWQITEFARKQMPIESSYRNLKYNRVIIRKGESAQLVYYWFQQRGRLMANEYLVKWYLFWDALTKNRTDGALVRLVTRVKPDEPIEAADKRLSDFAKVVTEQLDPYIPT